MPSDIFWYMLDHPTRRNIDLCGQDIEYMTDDFSQEIYEASCGKAFANRMAAYQDWVDRGRSDGCEFSAGKNTYLKILLKVKDEPELIENWINYHARIVGYHNLIIIDCGSTDPDYLNIINRYKDKILILEYSQYYDHLHSPAANVGLYRMIEKNCKYVALIDADEYLFGYMNRMISGSNLVPLLQESELDFYAGTWFNNAVPPSGAAGGIDWSMPIHFGINQDSIRFGTLSGKAIIKSVMCFQAGHLGHNLHVREAAELAQLGSFGKIGVFHINKLSERITKNRALKHLRSKNAVPPDIVDGPDIAAYLRSYAGSSNCTPAERVYVNMYLDVPDKATLPSRYISTLLLGGASREIHPIFSEVFEGFDFKKLLRDRLRQLGPLSLSAADSDISPAESNAAPDSQSTGQPSSRVETPPNSPVSTGRDNPSVAELSLVSNSRTIDENPSSHSGSAMDYLRGAVAEPPASKAPTARPAQPGPNRRFSWFRRR